MNMKEKVLVITRLQSFPSNIRVAIGKDAYNGKELIEEVEKETEVGEKIVQIHMEYLRSLKEIVC